MLRRAVLRGAKFCHDHGWPPELMKKIFFLLYEKDIVFERGFLHWRESLAKMTPGKDEGAPPRGGVLCVARDRRRIRSASGAERHRRRGGPG